MEIIFIKQITYFWLINNVVRPKYPRNKNEGAFFLGDLRKQPSEVHS